VTTSRPFFGRQMIGVAVYALAAAALFHAVAGQTFPDVPLHSDTNRDLLFAGDCRTSETCPLRGPPMSFPWIHQGGLWMLHLAVLQEAGLSLEAIKVVSVLALLVAALLMHLMGQRLLRGGGPVSVRSLVLLAFVVVPTGHILLPSLEYLWSPGLIPLPAAALTVSTALAAETRKTLYWVAALFSCALLVHLHPVNWILLPFLFGLWVLYPPRRELASLSVGLVVFAASIFLLSRDTFWTLMQLVGNLSVLSTLDSRQVFDPAEPALYRGHLLEVFVWGTAFVLAMRFGGLRWSPAGIVLLVLATLPVLLLSAAALVMGRSYGSYYLLPYVLNLVLVKALVMVQVLSVSAAWLTSPARRWVPALRRVSAQSRAATAVFVGLACLLALSGFGSLHPGYGRTGSVKPAEVGIGDVEAVADVLPDLGVYNRHQALRRLRGPNIYNVLSTLDVFLPDGDGPGDQLFPTDLVLVFKTDRVAPGDLPPGWRVVQRNGGFRMVLAPFRTVLDWSRLKVGCVTGGTQATGTRIYEGGYLLESPQRDGHPWIRGLPGILYCRALEVTVPVRLTSDTGIILYPYWHEGDHSTRAEVVRIDGMKTVESAPAPRVTIAPGQAGKEGKVMFRWMSKQAREFYLTSDMTLVEAPLVGPLADLLPGGAHD